MEFVNSPLGAEGVLEGNTFDVLDAAQKFVEGDVALLESGDLCSDTVVGDGTIDDVVVVERPSVRFGAVVIDEVRPLLGVGLEALASLIIAISMVEP